MIMAGYISIWRTQVSSFIVESEKESDELTIMTIGNPNLLLSNPGANDNITSYQCFGA